MRTLSAIIVNTQINTNRVILILKNNNVNFKIRVYAIYFESFFFIRVRF